MCKMEDVEIKISVIVTAFNVERYIADCIWSICNQTYSNLEIIVINDGSTDATLKVVEEIARVDRRIRIFSQSNSGVAAAKNLGIEYSNGEYVGFVDGDDIIDENMYYVLLKNSIENNADISEVAMYRFNDAHQRFGCTSDCRKHILKGNEILKNFFWNEGHDSSLCTKIIRSNIVKKYRMNNGMDNYEDAYLTYFCLKDSKISCFQNISLYGYRKRLGSQSSWNSFSERHMIGCKQVLMIRADVEENVKELKPYADTFLFNVCLNCTRLIVMSKQSIREEQTNLRELIDILKGNYKNASGRIGLGRKMEYWLLINTRYGDYYMWKMINFLRSVF